jgi:hypothetical protein
MDKQSTVYNSEAPTRIKGLNSLYHSNRKGSRMKGEEYKQNSDLKLSS